MPSPEVPEVRIELDEPARPTSSQGTRPGGTSLLEDHGLTLGFLLSVLIGTFLAISVVRLALQESRLAGLDSERSQRCYSRQLRALDGALPFEPSDLPEGVDELPVKRDEMATLVRAGKLRGTVLCPDQGPLRKRDDFHFQLVRLGGDLVEIRCRSHGMVPEELFQEAATAP